MRKMIALILVLSLLLCGCGGKEETQSMAASEGPVSEVASETVKEPSVEEVSVVEEPGVPEDPAELGKWVFALSDAASEEITAYDVDITVISDVTTNGENTSTRTTGRIKELVAEDETVTYYSSIQADGLTTDIWYSDGVAYQTDIYGSFRAPMEQDEFLEEYSLLKELEGLDENSFGLLTAEATEKGYVMHYGELSSEGEQIYIDFYNQSLNEEFSGTGVTVEVTEVTIDATMEMDKDGYPIRDDKEIVLSFTLAGMECSQKSTESIVYNKAGSELIIDVPVDDESFKEASDIKVADYYINGYAATMANLAMHYENATILTIADEVGQDTAVATDVIVYTMASGSMSAQWDTIELFNDEVVYTCTDAYSGGEGTLTTDAGVESYTYDDATFLSDIYNFVTYNSDSFDYGLSYTLETQGEETVLTYELEDEYVELAIEDYLTMYAPEYSLYDADGLECSGSVVVCFNAAGMIMAQSLSCVCEADFGGIFLTFTLDDAGAVVATGGDVVLSGAVS